MLVLSCDEVPVRPLPVTGRQVGVDLGITRFATVSDGSYISNPRFERAAAETLAAAQKRLNSAQPGSRNRKQRRRTLAARYRKIRNQRRDFHFKIAHQLVESYDLIAVENLAVSNMRQRAKPSPDPNNPGGFLPNGAAAKTGLNRSITDVGWGQFISILRAKAEEAGRTWIEVDPRHTSDRCENCGLANPTNRATQAMFRCQACGHSAQADEHAARNILRAGLALHAQVA